MNRGDRKETEGAETPVARDTDRIQRRNKHHAHAAQEQCTSSMIYMDAHFIKEDINARTQQGGCAGSKGGGEEKEEKKKKTSIDSAGTELDNVAHLLTEHRELPGNTHHFVPKDRCHGTFRKEQKKKGEEKR